MHSSLSTIHTSTGLAWDPPVELAAVSSDATRDDTVRRVSRGPLIYLSARGTRVGSHARFACTSMCAVVAQGMGSFSGGGIAAELAVELIPSLLRRLSEGGLLKTVEHGPRALPVDSALEVTRAAFQRAGECIYQASKLDDFLDGMTASITLAFAHEDQLIVGHVGDSRAYLARGSSLERLTTDHVHSEHAAVVTRTVGRESQPNVDVKAVSPQGGDAFVLCTRAGSIEAELLGPDLEERVERAVTHHAGSGTDVAVVVGRILEWGR
jgi:PPM family protein phosphatase